MQANMSEWKIVHTRKEGNRAAHELTQFGAIKCQFVLSELLLETVIWILSNKRTFLSSQKRNPTCTLLCMACMNEYNQMHKEWLAYVKSLWTTSNEIKWITPSIQLFFSKKTATALLQILLDDRKGKKLYRRIENKTIFFTTGPLVRVHSTRRTTGLVVKNGCSSPKSGRLTLACGCERTCSAAGGSARRVICFCSAVLFGCARRGWSARPLGGSLLSCSAGGMNKATVSLVLLVVLASP